jgi:hypothetical protein
VFLDPDPTSECRSESSYLKISAESLNLLWSAKLYQVHFSVKLFSAIFRYFSVKFSFLWAFVILDKISCFENICFTFWNTLKKVAFKSTFLHNFVSYFCENSLSLAKFCYFKKFFLSFLKFGFPFLGKIVDKISSFSCLHNIFCYIFIIPLKNSTKYRTK